MSEYEKCMAALQRPANYADLEPARQWDIDRSLGLLDWGGIDLDKARECVEAGDIQRAVKDFKMNLPELAQVIRVYDLHSGGS